MKKYEIIYQDLKDMIKSGKYKQGDNLPSEKELMDKYSVSRYTVRGALSLLEEKSYIQKKQGASSTITYRDPLSMPISEITSFQEVNKIEGLNAQTIVENLEIIKDKHLTKKIFGIDEAEEIYKVIRTRIIGGERVILDIDYFRRNVIENLPLTVAQASIYQYIENDLGLNIGYAIKEFYAERPSKEDENYLDIENYDVVIVVESQTFLEDNTVFQKTFSRHRPDRFKFVEIAKRQK